MTTGQLATASAGQAGFDPAAQGVAQGLGVRSVKQFLTFGAMGAIGTVCHYVVLILLVEGASVDPLVSTLLGFVAGAVVNYWLNYHVTFRSRQSHALAFPRFATTAAVGALLNLGLMVLLIHRLGIHYLPAQLCATATVLVSNFLLSKFWAFSEGPSA